MPGCSRFARTRPPVRWPRGLKRKQNRRTQIKMKTRLGLSFWRIQNLKKKGGKENTNRVNETLIKINLKQKCKEKKNATHTKKQSANKKEKRN